VLANFPQSQLGSPNPDWLQWYLDFITSRGCNIAAVLGHPDRARASAAQTRKARSEMTPMKTWPKSRTKSSSRPLETAPELVFQVLANTSHAHAYPNVDAHQRSRVHVGSRRKGAIGIGFNLGIPIMAALSQSHASGVGVGEGLHAARRMVSRRMGHQPRGRTIAFAREYSDRRLLRLGGASHGVSDGTSHGVRMAHHTPHRVPKRAVIHLRMDLRRAVAGRKQRHGCQCRSWKSVLAIFPS